jgi:hypothetical protein
LSREAMPIFRWIIPPALVYSLGHDSLIYYSN